MSDRHRTFVIRALGALIVLLGIGAALLPAPEDIPARMVIGLLLIAAALIELAAAFARRGHRIAAGAAAVASLIAGLRLALDPNANFFTVFNIVILWLMMRSAALFFAGTRLPRPVCTWTWFAAAVDFLLAVLLLAGLPVAFIVHGLFGPTGRIVATFSWIVAASLIAAGSLLVIAAAREPRPKTSADE